MSIRLQKYPIFLSFLIILTYLLLLIDTMKYPGFVRNHLFIDSKIYFAVVVILMLFTKIKSKILNFVLKINFFVLIIALMIYLSFFYLEGSHYQNFVLSTYHFNLEGLTFLVLFPLSIFLITKFRSKWLEPAKIKNGAYFALLFLLIYTLATNVGVTLTKSLSGDFFVLTHTPDSYDQKMSYQWGNFYNYMVFVKNNTPENAEIVIPPEIAPWWTRSGNALLVNSFLYPRKLIQFSTVEIPEVKNLNEGTYIMIAWGDWECERYGCDIWPVELIKAKEVVFKDQNSAGVKEVRENFTYDPGDKNNPFGLLRI